MVFFYSNVSAFKLFIKNKYKKPSNWLQDIYDWSQSEIRSRGKMGKQKEHCDGKSKGSDEGIKKKCGGGIIGCHKV